jgi:uncharacterized membrane protein YraQ (UPF0718 family)
MAEWFQFSFLDFSYAFLSVLLEGVPFILVGTLIAGLIDQFLPPRLMTRLLPSNAYAGIAISAALGMIFPMCECGVVPVIRRLMAKGLPVSNAVAYMLAAPVVNPLVAISTLAAFRGQSAMEMMILRLGVAWLVAVIVGMAVQNLATKHVLKKNVLSRILSARETGGDAFRSGPMGVRMIRALRVGTRDFLEVMFYFVLGVAVASVFSTAINQAVILPLALDIWYATASMMLLGFLLSLCSTSDAFIAATFVAFPAVSKLAFLVFGPMIDLKLIFLYSSVFRKRFVFGLAIGLFILVGLISVRLSVLGI